MSCSATSAVLGSRPFVALEHLESVKWFAAAVMLVEHYCRYVVGELPEGVYAVGRTVFPLFILALVCGLGESSTATEARVLRRMVVWFAISSALAVLVRDVYPFTIIGTLALGVMADRALRSWQWVPALACVFLGFLVEAGPLGVVAVALMRVAVRDEARRWVFAGAALCAICYVNGDWWALLTVPVVYLLRVADVCVPRVRHAFYFVYAVQFPAFALLGGLL